MIKIVINPKFDFLYSFVKEVIYYFDDNGTIIYKGRNLLKSFELKGENYIIKSFRSPHLINRFVYTTLRTSKSARSYKNAFKLIEKGFLTPKPVAYIEERNFGLKRSFYISEQINNFHEMREFWIQPEIGNRLPILKAFAEFTADLHKNKILHKDYSSGNIIYTLSEKETNFYLVDINRMQFNKSISEEEGYKNFRSLWLPDETYKIIATYYAYAMGYDVNKAIEQICYYKNQFMQKKK